MKSYNNLKTISLRSRLARVVERIERVFRAGRSEERILQEFIEFVQDSRDPVKIQRELVASAGRIAGARRVQLFEHVGMGNPPRLIATWPFPSRILGQSDGDDSNAKAYAKPGSNARYGGSDAVDSARSFGEGNSALSLPLRTGGQLIGMLRVDGMRRGRSGWTPAIVRRLTILGALAAAATQSLKASRLTDAATARDPATGLHNANFLAALLSYSLAPDNPTRRNFSLLALSIDQINRIRDELGSVIEPTVVQNAARTLVRTLRASDVSARYDADRFVAVLTGAETANAVKVAESIRHAVAEAGVASAIPFRLSCSIGVAGFPEHADQADDLLDTVFQALEIAVKQGGDRVVVAKRPPDRVVPKPQVTE